MPGSLPLARALADEFDVDDLALARAIRERSSVNIFHRASAIKVDLFVMGGTPLDEEPMHRRLRVHVTADSDRYLYAYTPEDILLRAHSRHQCGRAFHSRSVMGSS